MYVNSKGYSIIEGLIAIGILSIGAALVAGFGSFYQPSGTSDAGLQRACRAYAQSIVNSVQQESYYMGIANYIPTTATRKPSPGIFTSTNSVPNIAKFWQEPTSSPDNRISDAAQAGATPLPPALNNNLLVQGSLRSLGAIYNQTPGVRCALGAYDPLTNNPAFLPMPASLQLLPDAPNVRIRINPYDYNSHAAVCTPAIFMSARGRGTSNADPLFDAMAPTSGTYVAADLAESTAATETLATMNPLAGAQAMARRNFSQGPNNLGMELIAQVDYTFEGENFTCVASQRFEYPFDNSPPPPPVATIEANTSIQNPTTPEVLRDYCAGPSAVQTASASISIGYVATVVEGGVQFMCKDLSWVRTPINTAPCLTAGGAVIVNNQPVNLGGSTFRLLDPAPRVPYAYNANFGVRDPLWQPCDLLRQCNIAPTLASASTADPANLNVTLNYDLLPAGCVMNFEVVAVDTSGNHSRVQPGNVKSYLATPPTTYTSIPFMTENFTARDDEIYYPTCGNTYYWGWDGETRAGLGYYCPPAPGFPNGYYKCGTSCS